MRRSVVCLAGILLGVATMAAAQDLTSFEKRVSVKTLANGLTVLVCERPEAPVASFYTHVDVGSDREVAGITGLAHIFEHMAFKGTDKIGANDFVAEKTSLEKLERAYLAYDAERRRPTGRDAARELALEKDFRAAIEEAEKYVKTNELGEIVQREGGVGLNAFTSTDQTGYVYSFPSNRLELWAYLESERFRAPVMRQFYKERSVIQEERRMSRDNSPNGRLFEQFQAAAFTAHPYGHPVIGWASDLEAISATDALAFHKKYYVPANMLVTVVGDVKAPEVFAVVEKYFGRLPAGAKPEPVRTSEPAQRSERIVIVRDVAQPYYVEGYQRPDARHPDDAVYDAIADVLSRGRTSRLYRSLVRDKQIAANASGGGSMPGDKYTNLFMFSATSTPGHTPEELRDALRAEIERLKTEDVSDQQLKMTKTRARVNLIRGLGNNMGLAQQLAYYQVRFGDWRELFRSIERIDRVTKEDIRRVASATFVAERRTVAILESTRLAGASPKGGK